MMKNGKIAVAISWLISENKLLRPIPITLRFNQEGGPVPSLFLIIFAPRATAEFSDDRFFRWLEEDDLVLTMILATEVLS
ncbi:MAG: hypothetical protein ABSF63_09690 [Candidatus Bathyarchaeia archaeon]